MSTLLQPIRDTINQELDDLAEEIILQVADEMAPGSLQSSTTDEVMQKAGLRLEHAEDGVPRLYQGDQCMGSFRLRVSYDEYASVTLQVSYVEN